MITINMAYDKSRDDDDTGGMNDMIFRSTNIYYNQHHDISHFLELHDEVLMVVTMARMMMIITMIQVIMTMVIIKKIKK
jgi:hypothetical protein